MSRERTPTSELGTLPGRLRIVLRRLKAEHGYSQNRFARDIGYDQGDMSRLMKAEHDDPILTRVPADVLVRAARLGGKTVGWLVAGEYPEELGRRYDLAASPAPTPLRVNERYNRKASAAARFAKRREPTATAAS